MSSAQRHAQLESLLHQVLPDANLTSRNLPDLPELQLWLLDPANLDRAFTNDETQRLLEQPPYWGFCWGSGAALARWVLDNPEYVRGKQVLDFGSGSGVVALACSAAGAARSIACDLDPGALLASGLNAELNGLPLERVADYFAVNTDLDLIFAADVLYDQDNHGFLDQFRQRAPQVLIADSRVRDLQHPHYCKLTTLHGQTWPELNEPLEFRQVALYQALA